MKLSKEHQEFQTYIRDVIRSNLPEDIRLRVENDLYLHKSDYVRWQKVLYEKECFAKTWPTEYGGPGWDLVQQYLFEQENALAGAPMVMPYGVGMVGPVLIQFGTEKQKSRYLPGILNSDTWWCQGYSEPNAGSDLASLRCKAVRTGEEYVINGTKIWTTQAHYADMMHALVRTDDSGKKQQGITFLLIDMKSPGLTVRPIVTIDGVHHTNQIFFDNVRVPLENRVGEEGAGWTIAKFLLEHERASIADTAAKLRMLRNIEKQITARFSYNPDSAEASIYKSRKVQLEIEVYTLIELEQKLIQKWYQGNKRPHEAPVLKVRGTEIEQALTTLAMDLRGEYSSAFCIDAVTAESGLPEKIEAFEIASGSTFQYLRARAASIYGGSNEIQRGIIANSSLL